VLVAMVVGLGGLVVAPPWASADTPLGVPSFAGGRVDAGLANTCALLDTKGIICWGYGNSGQLGYGSTIQGPGFVPLPPGRTPTQVDSAAEGTCAVLDDGSLACWGYGLNGALGNDSQDNIADGQGQTIIQAGPVRLPLGRTAVQVSTGGYQHTCAVLDNGSLACWGSGNAGELGYNDQVNVGDGEPGSLTIRQRGVVPLPPGRTVKTVSAGYFHTCAILDDATVRCWGSGVFGQLGYGSDHNIGDGQPGNASIANAGTVPIQSNSRIVHISKRY
jgi:alpha-tubulin suppressor-like RCC1 family protein